MARMLRIASYRIHQSLVEKPLGIEEYWRIDEPKPEEKEELFMTDEMMEKIKKIHGIK